MVAEMAWKDWRTEVPRVALQLGSFNLKRRVPGQKQALFRLVGPMRVDNKTTGEHLTLASGALSDGSTVPGALWGVLEAGPADLLLPGFVHDFAYRRDARWRNAGGGSRSINRYEADLLHIAVSRLLGVSRSDQAKIFYALRVGGLFAFQQRTVDWDGMD